MYGQNKGTNMLKIDKVIGDIKGQDGLFASSVFDKDDNTVIVKIVNTSDKAQSVTVNLQGIKGERTADVTTLYHSNRDAENSLEKPELIKPVTSTIKCESSKASVILNDELKPMSFKLYKIKK